LGALVMLTTNQNPDKGVFNGAIGTVMELRRNPNGDITSVRMRLEDARFEFTYVHRSVEKTFTNPETGPRHTLRTFPLRLAYARTACSVQGATLRGRVYVHIRNAFARGMAYVMLSRGARQHGNDQAGGRPEGEAHPPRRPQQAVGAVILYARRAARYVLALARLLRRRRRRATADRMLFASAARAPAPPAEPPLQLRPSLPIKDSL